jgi:hypothetical protein
LQSDEVRTGDTWNAARSTNNESWGAKIITAIIASNAVLVANNIAGLTNTDTATTHPKWHINSLLNGGTNGTRSAAATVHAVATTIFVGGLRLEGIGIVLFPCIGSRGTIFLGCLIELVDSATRAKIRSQHIVYTIAINTIGSTNEIATGNGIASDKIEATTGSIHLSTSLSKRDAWTNEAIIN